MRESKTKTDHPEVISRSGGAVKIIRAFCGDLGMIYFFTKQGIQKRLAGRLVAASAWLDRNEDCIDFGQLLGIVKAQHPTAI